MSLGQQTEPATAARRTLDQDILGQLRLVLVDILGGRASLPDAADLADFPLARLGLDSASLVAFVVAVEDRFAVVWDDDVPGTTFTSLRTVTDFVTSRSTTDTKETTGS